MEKRSKRINRVSIISASTRSFLKEYSTRFAGMNLNQIISKVIPEKGTVTIEGDLEFLCADKLTKLHGINLSEEKVHKMYFLKKIEKPRPLYILDNEVTLKLNMFFDTHYIETINSMLGNVFDSKEEEKILQKVKEEILENISSAFKTEEEESWWKECRTISVGMKNYTLLTVTIRDNK